MEQGKFIRLLAGDNKPLKERIDQALDGDGTERWHSPLHDLITILGDEKANYVDIDYINGEQMEAMWRNWTVDANE